MSKYKVLFADLDGTLINTISGETFPKGVWDMCLNFCALDKIKELAPKYVFIVTNQGGIEKGFVDKCNFLDKMNYIQDCIKEYCDVPTIYEYCPFNDVTNNFRKPNIGMLERCYNAFELDKIITSKSEILMIGDASGKPGQFSDSDKKTAENFGIDYLDVEDFCKTNFND